MTSLFKYLKFDLKRNMKLTAGFFLVVSLGYALICLVTSRITVGLFEEEDFSGYTYIHLYSYLDRMEPGKIASLLLLLFGLILVAIITNQKVNVSQDSTAYNILQIPIFRPIHLLMIYIESGLFILVNYITILLISYMRSAYLLSAFRTYSLEHGIIIGGKIGTMAFFKYSLHTNNIFQEFDFINIFALWFLLIGLACLATIIFSRRINITTSQACLLLVALYGLGNAVLFKLNFYDFSNPVASIINGLLVLFINIFLVEKLDY